MDEPLGVAQGLEIFKGLFGVVGRRWRKWHAEKTLREANEAADRAQVGYDNPHLASYLAWKYPEAVLLEGAGHVYPVAIYPTLESQQLQPESVLGSFERVVASQFITSSHRYRTVASVLGLGKENRLCYAMRRLRVSPSPMLDCSLGRYLDALDTCDELAWELLGAHASLAGSSPHALAAFDKHLTLRSKLHERVTDPVTDGTGRCPAVGISVLLAYVDGSSVKLMVKRRGPTVAVHRGMLHVAPSCMFQPVTADYESEFSVGHNVDREYLEELFSQKDPTGGEVDWQYFYQDPCLMYLKRLIAWGDAELRVTGVAVNLMNLRPEVCLLLNIRSPDWIQYHRDNPDPKLRFLFNEEWAPTSTHSQHAVKLIPWLPYHKDDAVMLAAWAQKNIRPQEMVPPGAAALFLGKRVLDATMP